MNLGVLVKATGGAISIPAVAMGSATGINYGLLIPSKETIVNTEKIARNLQNKVQSNLSNLVNSLISNSIKDLNDKFNHLKNNVQQSSNQSDQAIQSSTDSINTQISKLEEVKSSIHTTKSKLELSLSKADSGSKSTKERLSYQLNSQFSTIKTRINNLNTELSSEMAEELSTSRLPNQNDAKQEIKSSFVNIYYSSYRWNCLIKIDNTSTHNFQEFIQNAEDIDAINWLKSKCYDLKSPGTISIDKDTSSRVFRFSPPSKK